MRDLEWKLDAARWTAFGRHMSRDLRTRVDLQASFFNTLALCPLSYYDLIETDCPYCITHRTNTRLDAVRVTSAAESASSTSLPFLSNALLSQETIKVGRCPCIRSIIHYLSPPLPLLLIFHVRCCSGEYFWCGNRHTARPSTVQRELS